jgi:hypothetical protein
MKEFVAYWQLLPSIWFQRPKKTTRYLKMAGVSAEIQTEHLPVTML